MGNRSTQNAKSASASINATLSVLNGVTPVSVESVNGFSINMNPFQFVIGLLQPIVGYDRIVNFLTELVVYGLPMLEDAVKISLIEALKGLFSCSVNPIISKSIINEGVVLDLTKIDLLKIMDRCPLDNDNSIQKIKGSFFYSGVEGMDVPDQLEGCSDLNAVIWFVKHRAMDRTVWYGWKTQGDEHELLTIDTKPSEKHGVITMEYSEKWSGLKDLMNNPLPPPQVPHGNCLHVFLGNAKGVSTSIETYPSSEQYYARARDFRSVSGSLSVVLSEIEEEIRNTTNPTEQAALNCEGEVIKKIQRAIEAGTPIEQVVPGMPTDNQTGRKFFTVGGRRIQMDTYTYTHSRSNLEQESIDLDNDRQQYIDNNYGWRTPEQNYYYHKTLFEFNTDYIMSVKFFDSKVVASQIVDILTGCFGISLNLSFEER
ncbi:MAG: hypothetical protein J6X18_10850 [Bacteroidales bacterium]|nr:hypothetical protein [Bacteroidales bacterium]